MIILSEFEDLRKITVFKIDPESHLIFTLRESLCMINSVLELIRDPLGSCLNTLSN